jgi:hypothetical protein
VYTSFRRKPHEQLRNYAKSTPPRDVESNTNSEQKDIPPEMWLTVLENTANAPWLSLVPQDHEDKLKRAYTLLYQIVLYLGRPQEDGKAEQFLVVSYTLFVDHRYSPSHRRSTLRSFHLSRRSGVPGSL